MRKPEPSQDQLTLPEVEHAPIHRPESVVIYRMKHLSTAGDYARKAHARQPQWHRHPRVIDWAQDQTPSVPRPAIITTRETSPDGVVGYCVRLLF